MKGRGAVAPLLPFNARKLLFLKWPSDFLADVPEIAPLLPFNANFSWMTLRS